MEHNRQAARKAIKLIKRKKGRHNSSLIDEHEVIEKCTELALGLQQGQMPRWYNTDSNDSTRKNSETTARAEILSPHKAQTPEGKSSTTENNSSSASSSASSSTDNDTDEESSTACSTARSLVSNQVTSRTGQIDSPSSDKVSETNPRLSSLSSDEESDSSTTEANSPSTDKDSNDEIFHLTSLNSTVYSPSTTSSPTSKSRPSSNQTNLTRKSSSPRHQSSPWKPRIPSSGLITTRSPSFSLEYPPIGTRFERLSICTSPLRIRGKQHPSPGKPVLALETYPLRPKQQTHEIKRKKKTLLMVKEHERTMNQPSLFSDEYWCIPFDPLREDVISDNNICTLRKVQSEEGNETLNEEEFLLDIDYWEVQKTLRLVKIGNPTATVLALCALKEMDLSKPSCNATICRLDGISLLLNILDTEDNRCRISALKVLLLLGNSEKVSNLILRKDGIKRLVLILDEADKMVVSLAADILWSLAKQDNARIVANKLDCIEKLLNVFSNCVKEKLIGENLMLCQSVCYALWSCSQGIQTKNVTLISESLPVIAGLVESQKEPLVIPLLGIIEECAGLETFRSKMEKEKFLEKVLWKIVTSNHSVQLICVKILFKCAGEKTSQTTLLKSNSLKVLMDLLKDNCHEKMNELLIILLGIVWRCSLDQRHRKKFQSFEMFPFLVEILKSDKIVEVKSTCLGVLSEFLRDEHYVDDIENLNVVNVLMAFLTSTEPAVLVNSARCLAVCARNCSIRGLILQQDGLRYTWSLLKSSNNKVVISGAIAVASICECPEESAEGVRSIVGGLELLMSLLSNTELTNEKVLISLCEATVRVAQDMENRSILIDYGLVQAIIRIYETENKILKYYITCLIVKCSGTSTERHALSSYAPFLIEGLREELVEHVHASICALYELSRDYSVCVSLQERETTKILLNLLGSSDERIQNAAAGCLANIRKSLRVTTALKQ